MALVLAALVVIPIGFLAIGILDPETEVWRQQWDTRLPGQLVDTAVLLVGVSSAPFSSAAASPGSSAPTGSLDQSLRLVAGRTPCDAVVRARVRDHVGLRFHRSRAEPMARLVLVATHGSPRSSRWVARSWSSRWCSTHTSSCWLALRLADQAGSAYNVARSLGAGPLEAARRVVIPMLRPALAAGVAVVMMETITDFATVQYFGVDTVTVGVFRIWRGTFDRDAASEFATLVLVVA